MEAHTPWVDRGNTFVFLEVKGGKLIEKYNI